MPIEPDSKRQITQAVRRARELEILDSWLIDGDTIYLRSGSVEIAVSLDRAHDILNRLLTASRYSTAVC